MNKGSMKGITMHETPEWETPQDLFDALNAEFHFTVDVASTDDNAKCSKHYTKEQDGLKQNWNNETVWCNPPYGGGIRPFLEKAISSNCTAVFLLPVRTDTKWFHDLVYKKHEVRFIKGRLKFGDSKSSAPFPSMIVIIRNDERK